MKDLVRCLQFYNFHLNVLVLFWIRVIFSNLNDVGKMQTSIKLLKLWYTKLEKISTFSLIIFVCMLFSCEVLQTSKSLISFMISSFVIWLKVKTETFLVFSFIAKMMKWLPYFSIAFKVVSLTSSKFEPL